MINSSAVAYNDPTEQIHSEGFEANDFLSSCTKSLNIILGTKDYHKSLDEF